MFLDRDLFLCRVQNKHTPCILQQRKRERERERGHIYHLKRELEYVTHERNPSNEPGPFHFKPARHSASSRQARPSWTPLLKAVWRLQTEDHQAASPVHHQESTASVLTCAEFCGTVAESRCVRFGTFVLAAASVLVLLY
jgi:hypothetical protein